MVKVCRWINSIAEHVKSSIFYMYVMDYVTVKFYGLLCGTGAYSASSAVCQFWILDFRLQIEVQALRV